MRLGPGLPKARRWRALLAASVAALALVAAGCGDDDDDGGSSESSGGGGGGVETIDMMLPFQDSIVWAGYEIARGSDGIYETEYKLKANTTATEGSGQIQQLIAGNRDFAITTTPETIIAKARGHDLVVIGGILGEVFTIASPEQAGISSLEDLDGEALGVTDVAGGEIPLVRAALNSVGLKDGEDVELVPVGPGGATALKALESGRVKAFAGAVNDLVPLENEGLTFTTILPDAFAGLPDNVMTVRGELLDDEEGLQKVKDLTKGWYEGVVFGEQNPEEGLARICELVPADCQDQAFADGFYAKAIEISIGFAESGGCIDHDTVTTVRDAVAVVDAPQAKDVDVTELFPNEFCEELTPDPAVVEALAKRSGG